MSRPTETIEARKRRRKIIWAMEAGAVILCAALLVVGLTVASGLESSAVEWTTKIGSVLLLALAWRAIPRVYEAYFRERPGDATPWGERPENDR